MLTAAVVIWPPREHKLSRKSEPYNPSDISNGLRFRGVDPPFWHSGPASANDVQFLTVGGNVRGDAVAPIRRAECGCRAADRRGLIRVKFKLFSFLENTPTGDSHALQSRRRQNPGDQGTRAARAPAAGISLLGEDRGTDLSHAAGDSPPPSRVGRQGARHHRAVLDARSQGGPGIRATPGRNEK